MTPNDLCKWHFWPQAIIFIHRHEFGISFGELTRPRIFEFKNATLKQATWLAVSQLVGWFDALLVKRFKDADWSVAFNITCVYIPFMTKRFLPQKWKLSGCTEFRTIFMSPYDKSYIFHKIKKCFVLYFRVVSVYWSLDSWLSLNQLISHACVDIMNFISVFVILSKLSIRK